MNYKRIIKQVAKQHNVSPDYVDLQIRSALKESGINITPELFIELVSNQAKKDYIS